MRRLQFLLLAAGLALFVWLLGNVGVAALVEGLGRLGWWFAAIFAVELLIDALHSEGWHWCLPRVARVIPRFDLLAARTAGVAVNLLTPTASVGGEVLKGLLIRRWVPLADGFASVMVDKLTFAVGQALFLLAGLFSVLDLLPFGSREREIAVVAVALWIVAVGAFFFLQRAGIFRAGVGVLRAIFGGAAFLQRMPGHAAAFDAKIADLLENHRLALAWSAWFHFLAQALRTLQLYFALTALGLEPSLGVCFTTAAALVFMEAIFFLVPGKLGVFEGGGMLVFTTLGYTAAAGLTVYFAIRLSELGSALLGLAALAWYQVKAADTEEPPAESPAAPEAAKKRAGKQA